MTADALITRHSPSWESGPTRFLDILDSPLTKALVDVQDHITFYTAQFWHDRGVKSVHLPVTTDSVSSPMGLGSDSEPVLIELYGQPTYLADSMQFLLEYGCRLSPEGAWYLMPSFRGESVDSTHLNQFFHSEAEIPGDLSDVIAVVEEYVNFLGRTALERLGETIKSIAGTTQHVEDFVAAKKFKQMTLDEACSYLQDAPEFVRDEGRWKTLTRAGEQKLIRAFGPAVWVSHSDALSVPFYQADAADHPGKTLNADLLFGLGEIAGCGQRHENRDQVLAALAAREVNPEHYDWYIRMKEARPMLTSGFGLGVERWVMWLLQLDDIRDVSLVPRVNGVSLQP